MNTVNIIGRITRDLELSTTQSGTVLTKGSIAVDGYKGSTNFFNFTTFSKTAETMVKYLKKGSQVGITGSLVQNRWKDNDGNNKSSVEILINNFIFCGSKSSGNEEQSLSGDAIVNKVQKDFDAQKYDETDFTDEVPF